MDEPTPVQNESEMSESDSPSLSPDSEGEVGSGDLESAAPVSQGERIRSLDVLRGFALLGILAPNIQAFSMIMTAYMNPTSYGDLTGVNLGVFIWTRLFFEQKFMTIFSMLFGAGILLMTSRAEKKGKTAWKLHYRRMGWLLVIGFIHANLLWFGDILFTYALCGMVVFWLRKLRVPWLLAIGGGMVLIGALLAVGIGTAIQYMPEAEHAKMVDENWQPSPEKVEEQLATFRGGLPGQIAARFKVWIMMAPMMFPLFGLWRCGGLMLIGMALFKMSFLTGERSQKTYLRMAIFGLVVGLPIQAFAIWQHFAHEWQMDYSMFLGMQYNYWVAPLFSLAYISLIMLLCKSDALPWLKRSLAAVGQMALTNYLAHSIICTTIFYGHGLGMFGKLERIEQLGVVISVWVLQMILSPIWLKYFRFGPFEWIWRSLSYWELQPMVRERQPETEPVGSSM